MTVLNSMSVKFRLKMNICTVDNTDLDIRTEVCRSSFIIFINIIKSIINTCPFLSSLSRNSEHQCTIIINSLYVLMAYISSVVFH